MKAADRHVTAHRGLARLYPENTLAAVRGALDAGLRQVEVDVQLTADRVPVLYHDAALARVSGRPGDIRRLPWARARRLPAAEPGRFGRRYAAERVPSLAQLAQALAPDRRLRTLYVELKQESLRRFGRKAMLDACLRALAPLRGRVVLISFDLAVLQLARRATRRPVGLVLRGLGQLRQPAVRALAPEWVFVDARRLPRRGPLGPLFGGARTCAWEVPDPVQARGLLQRGLSSVETFRADTLIQELRLFR